MVQHFRKRDKRIMAFDPLRISRAIAKAGRATGELGCAEAEGLSASANIRLVENYLNERDWKVRENSNMPYSLQGLNNYLSSELTSEYWLNRIYPNEIKQAHKRGDLHLHDLGLLAVYCVGWDLKTLLLKGFKGVEGKVESAPAKHLRSALGQIVNFFYTLQGEAAGAQAFSNFDTLLAPFIRYDNLDDYQVKQALQEFVFNTNIPTRVGFRTPFTNITLDLTIPEVLKDQQVIIGGLRREKPYSEFQPEMDTFNRAFAEVMMAGDNKGRAFTFPIPTYQITRDFPWENPTLDIIWKMTGKYGLPYFSNFVTSELSAEEVTSMCCRLRLDKRVLMKKGGGLFGASPLTGSIGVVTINLPRIGYASRDEADFLKKLDNILNLAAKSLAIKRNILEDFTDKGFYPYSRFYLKEIKENRGAYWSQHFSTIGIVGMNEACLNLLGVTIADKKGLSFSLRVMDFIREALSGIQETTGEMLNLEATPAESTSYRFAMLDKERYPKIICANEAAFKQGAPPFYTNSTQLPVDFTDDIFETLTLQDDLQAKYTGGTALHIYLGEQVRDTTSLKRLVRKIVTRFRIPYFTITPTFSVCPAHGYLNGEEIQCPTCNRETEIYSRIVGYLSPLKQWNNGKQAEFKMRRVFRQASEDVHTKDPENSSKHAISS